jgi:preprotein translocase subunit SecG
MQLQPFVCLDPHKCIKLTIMKKVFFIVCTLLLSVCISAQGNSGNKGKDKQKDKDSVSQNDQKGKSKEKEKTKEDKNNNDEHDRKVWDGVGNNSCLKPSKNQPAKVRTSFSRDFPNAINIRWTKCRGDWTATFSNGLIRSTAVYHANGDRRDTRTPIFQNKLPRVVLDSIFKKRPRINLGDIIKIELPNLAQDIFRIKDATDQKSEFIFLNALGEIVKYDY